MCVVQHQLIGVLREARHLLRGGLVEALLIEAHVQTASQHCCARFQLLGIGGVGLANRFQIFFETLALEAGLLKILSGADESSGLAANRRAERAEGATGFGSEKYESLLGFVGNDDKNSFVADGLVPGFDASKPGIGRRIGRATQKNDDHQIADGLAVGKIGMHPEAVSAAGDWELRAMGRVDSGALHANFDFRTNEVKSVVVGAGRGQAAKHKRNNEETDAATRDCKIGSVKRTTFLSGADISR